MCYLFLFMSKHVLSIKTTTMFFSQLVLLITFIAIISGYPWNAEPGPGYFSFDPQATSKWIERHEGFVDQTKRNESQVRAIFLGDSLTDRWANDGIEVWNQHYANRGAVNYGIGGDRTQSVLWRIEHGEFDYGISPKVVVIMIGSNNISVFDSPLAIAKGIKSILDQLTLKLPNTHLLLLSLLPRNVVIDSVFGFDRIVYEVNYLISQFHDPEHQIHYLDLTSYFEGQNGESIKTELYREDHAHLNSAGYEMWYEKMEPTFAELLG